MCVWVRMSKKFKNLCSISCKNETCLATYQQVLVFVCLQQEFPGVWLQHILFRMCCHRVTGHIAGPMTQIHSCKQMLIPSPALLGTTNSKHYERVIERHTTVSHFRLQTWAAEVLTVIDRSTRATFAALYISLWHIVADAPSPTRSERRAIIVSERVCDSAFLSPFTNTWTDSGNKPPSCK